MLRALRQLLNPTLPAAAAALGLAGPALASPGGAAFVGPRLDPSWHPAPRLMLLQEAEPAPAPASPDGEAEAEAGELTRSADYEVNFRGRMVSVPESLLDIWYFDEDDPSWSDTARNRPRIGGYGLGLEFVLKGESANGIFYVEYVKSLVPEGYWDDREEPPDPTDGDFLEPTNNLGLAVFGADYAYEAHLVRTENTNGAFGLSFLVGGGLGVAYMIGDLNRWGPGNGTDCPAGTPAYVCYDAGFDPVGTKQIPKVYPMVDINAGLRFNFGDRLMLRVEGGLHSLLYYGAAVGVMF